MCDLNQLLSFVLDNPKELFGTQKEGTPSLLVVFIKADIPGNLDYKPDCNPDYNPNCLGL